MHPDEYRFIWRQRNPEIHCRLDFFLISQGLCSHVTQADIIPGYRTDHSVITFSLTLKSNPRGPGFWKLNTSLLTEVEYINRIKAAANEVAEEYKDDNSVNDCLLWEMIKMKTRECSIKYAKLKKIRMKNREADLEDTISHLEKTIERINLSNEDREKLTDELKSKKKEFQQINQYKTKGSIIRSKARWYIEGEKNSKYFLNLEKRHCKNWTIGQLKTNNQTTCTSDKDILKECKRFYTDLYKSKIVLDETKSEYFFHSAETLDTPVQINSRRKRIV